MNYKEMKENSEEVKLETIGLFKDQTSLGV